MKNPGIYILTSPSGKQYVGKDSNLPNRAKHHFSSNSPQCRYIHRAIQKYGRDAFSVEIIQYPSISEEALNAVERWKIRQLQTLSPSGYNLVEGGEGGKHSEETHQKFRKSNRKRVADGSHNLLGGEIAKKRVEEGTHHFLGGELQRRIAKKRVEEGTHHFLGGELQRRTNKNRVADGTHHFLDGEISRRSAKKRVEEGTHHFLGGEISRRNHQKRIEEGTHHLLGENHPMKRLAKEGRHPSTLKRIKGEWCYIIALSRFWYEIHDYTLKRRAEFLSKDIPDLSNAEQEYLC